MVKRNSFEGDIEVASRIVDYLSSGLYESPAASLKELVNNSYDADATRVDVFVKPDADRIIIEDDGHGMNQKDFERHFRVISESFKREDSDTTVGGRPKIGKIGIGFIAANEICDVMEIVSTKRGSTELLEVSIDFSVMRGDVEARKTGDTLVKKAHYEGQVSEAAKDEHFTKIFLKQIRGEARSILLGVETSEYRAGKDSLYGLSHESIFRILKESNLKSWSELNTYSQNMLEVALNVPVKYYENWIPDAAVSKIEVFRERAKSLDFNVYFDGTELRKPIVYSPNGKFLVDRFSYKGENVAADGFFYAQHGVIKPQELQGILIRIRNAAVGDFDPNFLEFSPSIGPLIQSWISGEIFVDDQLEDAMNIDRRTLRVSHPSYVELQKAVHEHLGVLMKRVRDEIYGSASKERKAQKAEQIQRSIQELVSKNLSSDTASKISKQWDISGQAEEEREKLLKRRNVDDIYSLVIDIASEMLPKELREKFLEKLTERLSE